MTDPTVPEHPSDSPTLVSAARPGSGDAAPDRVAAVAVESSRPVGLRGSQPAPLIAVEGSQPAGLRPSQAAPVIAVMSTEPAGVRSSQPAVVAEVMALLESLPERPVAEHVEVYDDAQRRLGAALAELAGE